MLNENLRYSKSYVTKFFMHFIARAFSIAVLFVVSFMVVIALVVAGDTFYNMKKGNNVVPLIGGYVIITPSMVPTIKVKDAVLVRRMKDSELEIGDIITFKSTDERYTDLTITHRIVGTQSISNGSLVYRTKGDNNRLEDSEVVTFKNIYGKVILKLPKLGYIRDFISKPIGFIFLIILPLIGIIAINISVLKRKVEEI